MGLLDIPTREERKEQLNKGCLSWVNTEVGEHRSDPDHYIMSMLFRNHIKFTIAALVIVTVLTLAGANSDSHLTLYEKYKSNINMVLPCSILIVCYYFMLFIKNVDQKKYNFLHNRKTGKPVGVGFISFFLVLPTAYELIRPSYVYWIIETKKNAAYWQEHHNDPMFIIFSEFIVLFFYPLSAFMFVFFSFMAMQEIRRIRNLEKGINQ